jgi:hypothetical protein
VSGPYTTLQTCLTGAALKEPDASDWPAIRQVMAEQADEIERLRRANAELWDRYKRIRNQLGTTDA